MAGSDPELIRDALLDLVEACRSTGALDEVEDIRISDHQARILRQLDDTDPTMVGELADFFGVTPSTMSLNLKRLQEAGCVRRSRDPDDRRVMNVRLTDMGQRIKAASSVLDLGRIDALLRALRPDERTRAVEGVRLLVEGAHRAASRTHGYLGALTGEAVDA